jgi:hypothetical protein
MYCLSIYINATIGCGGFGKGNFSELFKAVEDFEIRREEASSRFLGLGTRGSGSGSDRDLDDNSGDGSTRYC